MTAPHKSDALLLVEQYADEARDATDNRNAAVKWARIAKASLREIAVAAGMTPAGIAKILKRNSTKVLDN